MDYQHLRSEMVRTQLRRRGVKDPSVVSAMDAVPREAFVPEDMQELSYRDSPLPIGEGQTISQPFIVARMIEYLELGPEDRVLEIGTGSGYGAAVLSRIARTVVTVERRPSLAEKARGRMRELGLDNVVVVVGDGSLGWPEGAPYDAVVGTAGAPKVPEPLKKQLAPGGRIVLPVGTVPGRQVLVRLRKTEDGNFEEDRKEAVRFVPLVGKEAWSG